MHYWYFSQIYPHCKRERERQRERGRPEHLIPVALTEACFPQTVSAHTQQRIKVCLAIGVSHDEQECSI